MSSALLLRVFILHHELFLNTWGSSLHFLNAAMIHILYFTHSHLTILVSNDRRRSTILHFIRFPGCLVYWYIRPNVLERDWLLFVHRFYWSHRSFEAKEVPVLVDVELAARLCGLVAF